MEYTPLDAVPLGRAGTGAAFILDPRLAMSGLDTVERQLRYKDLRAQHEANRRAKKAADENAAAVKAQPVTGEIAPNHTQRAMKGAIEYSNDVQKAREDGTFAGRQAEFSSRQQNLITDRAAAVGVNKQLSDSFTALDKDVRVAQASKEKIRKTVVYDENNNERTPLEQSAQLQKLDLLSPDYYDAATTYGEAVKSFNEGVRREIHGSRAPGAKFTEQQVTTRFGLESDKNGAPRLDNSGNYVFNSTGIGQFRDRLMADPVSRGVLMRDVAAAQQANPTTTIDDVVGQTLVRIYRPDVQQFAGREAPLSQGDGGGKATLSQDGAAVAGITQLVTTPGTGGDQARGFTFAQMPTRSLEGGKGPAKQPVAERVELGRVYMPGGGGVYSSQYLTGLHNAALSAPSLHFKDDKGNLFDVPASVLDLPPRERIAAVAAEADRRGAGPLKAVWMQPFAAAKPTQYSLVNGLDEAIAEATTVRRAYEEAAKKGKVGLMYKFQIDRASKETDPEMRQRILANAEVFKPDENKGVPVLSPAEIAAKVRKATDASEVVGYKEVDPQWESQTRAYTRGAYQSNYATRRLADQTTAKMQGARRPAAKAPAATQSTGLPTYGVVKLAADPAAAKKEAKPKTTGGSVKSPFSKK